MMWPWAALITWHPLAGCGYRLDKEHHQSSAGHTMVKLCADCNDAGLLGSLELWPLTWIAS